MKLNAVSNRFPLLFSLCNSDSGYRLYGIISFSFSNVSFTRVSQLPPPSFWQYGNVLRNSPSVLSPPAASNLPLDTSPVTTSACPLSKLITLRWAANSTVFIGTAAIRAILFNPSDTSCDIPTSATWARWIYSSPLPFFVCAEFQRGSSVIVISLSFSCQYC